MKSLNILIVGGGLGGPVAGYWLTRAGHNVTIVEQSPPLRAGGTQIDVRHQGVDVLRKMGLLEKVRKVSVLEAGTALVDRNNKTKVWLPGDDTGNGTSLFTQEIEIMRGDLVRVFHEATKDNVTYIFGKTVDSFEQDADTVTVTLSDGTKYSYDLLIGADGLGSHTRRTILGTRAAECFKSLNTYVGFWFIPRGSSDTNVARFYHMPGRKVAMLRSTRDSETQAAVMVMSDSEDLRGLRKLPEEKQREFWASTMKNSGWETDRMIAGVKDTTNFYCTEIAQIKAPTWSKGRAVLLGDAGYCPSPMTGLGTTSAVLGAYVLAGEIASNPDDLPTALRRYEEVYRPFVDAAQELPPMLDLLVPETQRGIAFCHIFVTALYWLILLKSWLKLDSLWARLFPDQLKAWRLPAYPALA